MIAEDYISVSATATATIPPQQKAWSVPPLIVPAEHIAALPFAPEVYNHKEIFVNIVSYRDPECQHTLIDLFHRASFPVRVKVGLVLQYDIELAQAGLDKDCFAYPLTPAYAKQVRTLRMHYTEAKGPCWARRLAQSLWLGEPYVLQIDAHMRFRPGWVRPSVFLFHLIFFMMTKKLFSLHSLLLVILKFICSSYFLMNLRIHI